MAQHAERAGSPGDVTSDTPYEAPCAVGDPAAEDQPEPEGFRPGSRPGCRPRRALPCGPGWMRCSPGTSAAGWSNPPRCDSLTGPVTTLKHYADPVSEVDRRAAAFPAELTGAAADSAAPGVSGPS